MLTSPYKKLSKATEKKLLIFSVLFFAIMAALMMYFDTPLQNEKAPHGIISFEFAKTADNASDMLKSWETPAHALASAEKSLWFDYIFMIAYALGLSLIIHLVITKIWKDPEDLYYRLGVSLLWSVFFAAFLDAIENLGLLQLFYGSTNEKWASLAFATASLKFVIIVHCLLYVLLSVVYQGFKKITNA